jgi:hypothetical protein
MQTDQDIRFFLVLSACLYCFTLSAYLFFIGVAYPSAAAPSLFAFLLFQWWRNVQS